MRQVPCPDCGGGETPCPRCNADSCWIANDRILPMSRKRVAGTLSEEAAEAILIRERWPEDVRCPRCGGADTARRAGRGRCRWRCRKCRHDFSVTTSTRLHASKAPLATWVDAALGAPVCQEGAMSASTRRRILRTVESTGLGPGPERLAALVAAEPVPVLSGPLTGLADGHRRVLGALRARLAGATAARVAADCALSASHTRRCLRRLRDAGFVESSQETVMWGYAPRRARLWRLVMSEQTLDALPQIGWLAPAEPESPPETVPPEFWYLFWSGECASPAAAAPRRAPHSRHAHRRPRRAGAHLGSQPAAGLDASSTQIHARLRQRTAR